MGARLLPRALPELLSYCIAIEREAAKRYAELERFLRSAGADPLADELARLGHEEREQYELMSLGAAARELPPFAGWELCWHFPPSALEEARPRNPREALSMALAFERRTQCFYEDVVEHARDDELRAFAADMAADEHRHVCRLELLLEREPEGEGIETEDRDRQGRWP